MIALIDYGAGNLASVRKALESQGLNVVVTCDANDIALADGIVVPGVGAFGEAIASLRRLALDEPIKEFIASGKPYLGICLGLQLLFTESDEGGRHLGLDVLPGRVRRFEPGLKVPHIGWNQIEKKQECPHLEGIADGSYVYFVHSYYVEPEDESVIATTTDYGLDFTSSVIRGNLFASQFHPEKSQRIGLRIIRNFGELVEQCR